MIDSKDRPFWCKLPSSYVSPGDVLCPIGPKSGYIWSSLIVSGKIKVCALFNGGGFAPAIGANAGFSSVSFHGFNTASRALLSKNYFKIRLRVGFNHLPVTSGAFSISGFSEIVFISLFSFWAFRWRLISAKIWFAITSIFWNVRNIRKMKLFCS